jgi:hypothetical protein
MKKHFNIRLDQSLATTFKQKAKQRGTTATALITQWVEAYCNDDDDSTDSTDDDDDLRSAIARLSQRISVLEEKVSISNDSTDNIDSTDSNDNVSTSNDSTDNTDSTDSNDNVSIGNDSNDSVSISTDSTDSDDNVSINDDSNDTVTTENPPSEIGLEATKEVTEEDNNLSSEKPAEEANKTLSDNDSQKPDDEGSSEDAIAEGITREQLITRLNSSTNSFNSSLSRYRDHPKKFQAWTRKKDPQNIGWVWNQENQLFYPVHKVSD